MLDRPAKPLNFDELDLNLLRVFDLIMREGNLTRAGKRLGRKPPAMSQLLGRLRFELGDPLFETSGRKMIPTRRALEIAPAIRAALEELRIGITAQAEFDPMTAVREFVIDMPIGGDAFIGPPLLTYAAKHAPGLKFRIASDRASILLPELKGGETALAIDHDMLAGEEMRHRPLYADPFVALSRKGHPAITAKGGLTADLFKDLSHVAISWTRTPGVSPVDERLVKIGIKRRVQAYVPTMAALPGIVESTDLLALMSARVARRLQQHWAIDVHPLPFELEPIPLHLIWHRRFDSDAAHAWLREALTVVVDRI